MVFGIAAFNLVVQGLTMPRLMDRLGVATRSDAKELYELLIGRARAVDAALEAAEQLERAGNLPYGVYKDFTAEYEREKDGLNDTTARLLRENPELRHEELLVGERRVLQQEKSALMDAMRRGIVSDDVDDRLTEEVDVKLDLVNDGESTAEEREEGYEGFWRSRAVEFGIDFDIDTADVEAMSTQRTTKHTLVPFFRRVHSLGSRTPPPKNLHEKAAHSPLRGSFAGNRSLPLVARGCGTTATGPIVLMHVVERVVILQRILRDGRYSRR